MYYRLPDERNSEYTAAFAVANKINPRALIRGSIFEVTDDGFIVTKEVQLEADGHRMVWHNDVCCGTEHIAKTTGKYPLRVQPELFGLDPLRDATGEIAP